MLFARLLTLAILFGGLYLLFRLAKKAWHRAELQDKVEEKVQRHADLRERVSDKLQDLEVEKEVASKVVVDKEEVEAYRKKLRDLDNL